MGITHRDKPVVRSLRGRCLCASVPRNASAGPFRLLHHLSQCLPDSLWKVRMPRTSACYPRVWGARVIMNQISGVPKGWANHPVVWRVYVSEHGLYTRFTAISMFGDMAINLNDFPWNIPSKYHIHIPYYSIIYDCIYLENRMDIFFVHYGFYP